jgi:alpha-pyrone synthase
MFAPTYINSIGTALPPHDSHQAFLHWAERQIDCAKSQMLFRKMAARSGIEHRWSVLGTGGRALGHIEPGGFYAEGRVPSTAERMAVYADAAPDLCVAAVEAIGALDDVTHLVLASCTGFVAPGIDQIVARRLGLSGMIERTLIGFMGCYAAVAALRTAHHIVRSRPDARVLVITVELCSLHLQPDTELEPILAMLLFGDGAAAAIVSAKPVGIAYSAPFSTTLSESGELIRWNIGDTGFRMHLSGAVPARIAEALNDESLRSRVGDVRSIDGWAVHAGGRSVLDAVERGFDLDERALANSRDVLRACGNMSSATLLFVLDRILSAKRPIEHGVALAFGPGLSAEGFHFQQAA